MRAYFYALVLPFALTLGCSGSVASTPGVGGAGSGSSSSSSGSSSSSSGAGGTSPGTLSATIGPFSIASGDEAVKCIVVDLGNPAPAFVRQFRTTLMPGSHHMIVYLSTEAVNPTPFDCQSFNVAGGSAIFIAQQAHSALAMPTDPSGVPVGLELAAHQTLRLEMHYINTTPATLDISGTVEMDVLPPAAQIIKSGFSFQGQPNVPTIPPNGEADTGVLFQPGIPGTHVFALTTHQHHLGTEMQVWFANSASDTSDRIADSTSWSDPPLVLFNPPLDLPAGGTKGFAYDCHWKNPTPNPVSFGLSANDEMCFFWNYYYPAP